MRREIKKLIKGFTLIELLVVIAIIALLSSIVLASLSTARNKAKDAAIKEDLVGIRTSAALYFSENNNYGVSYYAANPDTRGHSLLHEWFPELCPQPTEPGFSMFHSGGGNIAKSINEAIQHAGLFTRQENNLVVCGSNSSSYVVAALLNEEGPPGQPATIFCIDSQGNAEIYNDDEDIINDVMLWNGVIYSCP